MGARLTKRTVDSIAPTDRRITFWDGELPGFGIRVAPNGSKAFVVRYRANGGGRNAPERLITIGRYGTLTPDEARGRAKHLLASVKLGGDPAAERTRSRKMPSFGALADRMLDEAEDLAKVRPREARLGLRTIRNYRSLLRRHLQPAIGALNLDSITAPELARLHRKIGKDTPFTANRCLELVGSVFKFAAAEELVPRGMNPARPVPAFKENPRERFLNTEELSRLGEAIREAETAGVDWEIDQNRKTKHVPKENRRILIDPGAAAALRLLILTGARLREILHARWDGVDLERGILFVEGKTGRRPVLLPAPAAAILAGLPRSGAYVFPGEPVGIEKPRADLNRPWNAVRRKAKLDNVRIHDLRHSFASIAAGSGSSLPIIGKLLGHTQPQTTSRYSHLADDPLRTAVENVGSAVAAALNGMPRGVVIPAIPDSGRDQNGTSQRN